MKYIMLEISNEFDTLVAIVEWDDEMLKATKERMTIVEKMRAKDDTFASMSFYSGIELFEHGTWFSSWLEERGLEDEWENSSIISDERPEIQDDRFSVRVDMVRLSISPHGFWWTIRPKHSDIYMESPYFSMTDGKTKQLLEMDIQ